VSHPLVRPRFVDDHAPVSPNAVDRRRCGRNWHRDPGSLRWLIRFVVPGTAVATENEAQSGSGLQLQHVLLGFVSAYVANLEGILSNATVQAGAADIGSIQSSLTLSELSDGDEVFGMGVIGTPGHTPGSTSLFDTASGILVAGDAINGDGNGGFTGADPGFSSDLDAAAASVAKFAALAPITVALLSPRT
jgi:hypothetical protein